MFTYQRDNKNKNYKFFKEECILEQKKRFKIFTGKMAKYLMRKGYQIVNILPNEKNRLQTVFVMLDHDGNLQSSIEEFKETIKSKSSVQ